MINFKHFSASKQKGAALMIIVFILAIALTTYILKAMNAQTIRVDHQQLVRKNLNIAKQALIAWVVANRDYPGQMPYPDRGTDAGGYDGKSDCSGSNPINNQALLMGQLPMYGSTGCLGFSITEGLAAEIDDGYGNRLWYAVSPNLMHNYAPTGGQTADPVINSDTLDAGSWLRVLDHNGNEISNRVAAVIIAPGETIGVQSRSINATPDNYLDTYQKGGNTYSNSDYDDPNEDFIMGRPMSAIDANDASYTRPYLFNDQLVYITVDELMDALEKRAAAEATARLRDYFNLYGYFPYPSADFASNTCDDTLRYGILPFNNCTADALPTSSPDWFVDNGWDDLFIYAVSSDCIATASACSAGTLTVGTQSGIHAMIVSTGPPITTVVKVQSRLSATVNFDDYLDSVENISVANEVYDAVGKAKTNVYNDQMFIVAP